jgi:hypothetical protein
MEPGLQKLLKEGHRRMKSTRTARIGDRVSFSVSDVFLPEPSEVLVNLTADVTAEGVVVEFSDSGSTPRAYAVVRITPLQQVLLPVSTLHVLDCE